MDRSRGRYERLRGVEYGTLSGWYCVYLVSERSLTERIEETIRFGDEYRTPRTV